MHACVAMLLGVTSPLAHVVVVCRRDGGVGGETDDEWAGGGVMVPHPMMSLLYT